MDRDAVLAQVEPLVTEALESRGIEVVDVQFKSQGGHWALQVFIDSPQGVDLDLCQRASNILGPLLDEKDPIPSRYVLEVSSPGLDRVIKKDRDFERFQGRVVKVKVSPPVEGRRNFSGVLRGLRDGDIVLEAEGETVKIPRQQAVQVRLVPEF
ncbi:MAG: ribosome maturation factor RimP [Syntrophomonadaceae bacterium]|nr:ribosome maturation factor RimP [Syntrophomonadaceae bacterium]MDH7498303.1 ribosome maturation factor RimP [Syntrophomonadaceae bacterium]